MLSYISQKNLLSSSLLVLSFFLLSPEGKAMKEDLLENVKDDPRAKKRIAAIPLTFKKLYAQEYIENNGTLTITTKNDNRASYQAETNRVKVTPGEKFQIPYDIRVEDGGKMAFGVLNSARNGWIGREVILETGPHTGIKDIVIPKDETEISLVLLNYHLGTPGQSKFTAKFGLEKVEIQKSIVISPEKGSKTIPLKFKKLYAQEYAEKDGTLTITTDNNNRATYQAITDRVKVTPGETFQIPYEIKVEKGGKISFGVLNTKGDNWIGGEVILETGTHKSVKEILIPQGETDISLVLRNYHLGTAGQSKFTAKLGLEKEESNVIPLTFKKGTAVEYAEKDGILEITTDNNNLASYQAQTQREHVTPGETFQIPYEITVKKGGKIAFGVLNTSRKGWIGGEAIFLEAGTYKGVKEVLIPPGESEISLVLRNYHLGIPGQSKFTAKLGLEKEGILLQSAKLFFSKGIEVSSTDLEKAVKSLNLTNKQLKKRTTAIMEGKDVFFLKKVSSLKSLHIIKALFKGTEDQIRALAKTGPVFQEEESSVVRACLIDTAFEMQPHQIEWFVPAVSRLYETTIKSSPDEEIPLEEFEENKKKILQAKIEFLGKTIEVYAMGDGVKKDLEKAGAFFQVFEKIIVEERDADDILKLAKMYEEGHEKGDFLVKKNPEKVRELLKIAEKVAIEQGKIKVILQFVEAHGKGTEIFPKDPERALKLLKIVEKKAIEENDIDTVKRLVAIYEKGKIVGKDLGKAKQLRKIVEEKEIKEASAWNVFSLAEKYKEGNEDTEKDLKRASQLFKIAEQKALEENNSFVMQQLARMYRKGVEEITIKEGTADAVFNLAKKYGEGKEDTGLDSKRASELFEIATRKALEEENIFIIQQLAHMYRKGMIVERDLQKAKKLNEIVEEKEIKEASASVVFSLAEKYKEGDKDTEKDLKRASQLFKIAEQKALEEKNFFVIQQLAHMYKEGMIVERDLQKAKKLNEIVEEITIKEASASVVFSLAEKYKEGNEDTEKDLKRASQLFKIAEEKALKEENFDVIGSLVRIYKEDNIVQDLEKAKQLRKIVEEKEVKEGTANAVFNLAKKYGEGKEDTGLDSKRASELFEIATRKALEEENIFIIQQLADIYKAGKIVPKHLGKAIELYRVAAKQKTWALLKLGKIYETEESVRDLNQAINFYRAAAEKGNDWAMLNLGRIYQTEESVRNLNQAIYFYGVAAEKGSDSAMLCLGRIYETEESVRDLNQARKFYKEAAEKGNSYGEMEYQRIK
jgi:TPR repeat protein